MTYPTSKPVLVSVIMPMYNAERFVRAAIASILRERSVSLELIVINDGSTDPSCELVRQVRDPRLRLVASRGKGIAAALNTGLELAQGDLLVRCDADDVYPVGRLARQVHWLLEHPEFGAVCGNYSAIDVRARTVIQFDCGSNAEEITAELQQGVTRTHLCTFAIRTAILRTLGGFRDYFSTGEDIDLQLRMGDHCRVWYQPYVDYHYRLHHASITHTKSSSEREFFDFIAREFQKQRQREGIDAIQRGYPPSLPETIHSKAPLSAAQHIQGFLLGRAWEEFEANQFSRALLTGLRALVALPRDISAWRSIVVLWLRSLPALLRSLGTAPLPKRAAWEPPYGR